jgi:hypothetical protein
LTDENAALNEGRALFPGDLEFGRWLRSSKLEEGIHPADQSAAMWAAANPGQFAEAREADVFYGSKILIWNFALIATHE